MISSLQLFKVAPRIPWTGGESPKRRHQQGGLHPLSTDAFPASAACGFA